MAGRIKHMERSRRSHRTNEAVFTQFHRNAFKLAQTKETKMTIGQRLSTLVKSMMPRRTAAK